MFSVFTSLASSSAPNKLLHAINLHAFYNIFKFHMVFISTTKMWYKITHDEHGSFHCKFATHNKTNLSYSITLNAQMANNFPTHSLSYHTTLTLNIQGLIICFIQISYYIIHVT